MPSPGAAASSFNIEGELTLGFFGNQADNYHARLNGERIETAIARMLGFPSEAEFAAALENGLSDNPEDPDVVRTIPSISLHVHVRDENGDVF